MKPNLLELVDGLDEQIASANVGLANEISARLLDKAENIQQLALKAPQTALTLQESRINALVATPNSAFYQKSTVGTTGALLVVESGATTGQINLASVTPLATGYTAVNGDYVLLVYGVASGSAELIDGRVGSDGITYPSVGDAVRGQITDLKGSLSEITDVGFINWVNGKYLSTGLNFGDMIDVTNPTSMSTYRYAVIPCTYGDIFHLNVQGGSSPRAWCVTDIGYNVLNVSATTIVFAGVKIIQEKDAAYLILNDLSGNLSFKNLPIPTQMDKKLDTDLFGKAFTYDSTVVSIYTESTIVVYGDGNAYTNVLKEIAIDKYGDYQLRVGRISGDYEYWDVNVRLLDENNNILESIDISGVERLINFEVTGEVKKIRIYYFICNAIAQPVGKSITYEDIEMICTSTSMSLGKDVILKNNVDYKNRKTDKIIYIASSNSSDKDKLMADLICSGTDDQAVIKAAVNALTYGGTIILLDGIYYIDSFPYGNVAVETPYNGYARTINIIGSTENKSYLSEYGVVLKVTDTAISKMDDVTVYTVFKSPDTKVTIGDWQAYPNNVNFENLYIYLNDVSKKIGGIDGSSWGSMHLKQVGVYYENYFYERFNHLKPKTPTKGSFGIISTFGANDEMARIGMDTVNVGGLYIGIRLLGSEKLILNSCTVARCCYGYVFETEDKTLTLINCADEGNTHLPRFNAYGHITCTDFAIERLSLANIPDDPEGNTELYATEETASSWHGFMSYVIGDGIGINTFWKNGHGKNVKTINLKHNLSGTVKPIYPEYLEKFFDISTNKLLTWNGSNWVDGLGNVIS